MQMSLKSLALSAGLFAATAQAALVLTPTGPFYQLDDAFTAEIVSTSRQGYVGLTFLSDGRLVRGDGSYLYIHSATADTTVNGATTIRSSTVVPMTVGGVGYGMALGNDGFIYVNSPGGIRKVDSTTGASTVAAGSANGYYYGLKKQPSGKLVYNDCCGNVWQYDPVANTETKIYTSGIFSDDIAVDPAGNIFVAVYSANRIDILQPDGTFIRSVFPGHTPDGMAFGQGAIYSNNTDGTLTRMKFAGPGYTGAATVELVGSYFENFFSAYGDLSDVNPVDNAFYIGGYGFKYPNGAYADPWTVVKISLADGGGGFGNETPEPESLALALVGLAALAVSRRRLGTSAR